jgi:hypothetical protein
MESLARRVLAAFVGLWTTFSLALLFIACNPASGLGGSADAWLETARLDLAEARPGDAHDAYAEALLVDPVHPEAAFGLALTDLLLLPEGDAGAALLAELGLKKLDVEADLLGADGLLAELAAGLEDDLLEARTRSLLGLPAERSSGTSGTAEWLRGLPATTTAASLAARAGDLAKALGPVARWLEVAAGDPALRFEIPGSLLHLSTDIICGPPEAAALAALIRTTRAALSTVASYRWPTHSLRGLGQATGEELAVELSAVVARTRAPIGDLGTVRADLRHGLDDARHALARGQDVRRAEPGRVFAWDLISPADADRIGEFLGAMARALNGPAKLPDTEPPTEVNLDLLLRQAPAPPRDIPAFEASSEGEPSLRSGFWETLLAEAGAAEPPVLLGSEPSPHVFSGGVPADGLLDRWLDPLMLVLETDLGL